jgi:hypothetical protein
MAETVAATAPSSTSAGPTSNPAQLTRRLSSTHLTIQLHHRSASTDATQQLLQPVLQEVQHRLHEEEAPRDAQGLQTYTTCTQTGSRNMHWPLEYYGSPGFRLQYIQVRYKCRFSSHNSVGIRYRFRLRPVSSAAAPLTDQPSSAQTWPPAHHLYWFCPATSYSLPSTPPIIDHPCPVVSHQLPAACRPCTASV